MLKQQLQQRQTQKLSPQQIQLIKLLELPTIELEERVKQELQENPALEEGQSVSDDDREHEEDSSNDDSQDAPESDIDLSLGDYLTEDDIPEYKLREMTERAERKEDIPFSTTMSLYEYLLQQLGLRDLSERKIKIAEYIIGNLDDDGYLRRENNAIADDLVFQTGSDVSDYEIEEIIKIVQDFDPPGIGARNLKECLLIQLEKKAETPQVLCAINLLRNYFDEFSRKHYEKILRSLNINEEQLKSAIMEITTLDPKPGSEWGGETMENVMSRITPDFIVETHNGELFIGMNSRDIPDLHVSRDYITMLQQYADNKSGNPSEVNEAVLFVKHKIDSAKWFIDAIKQRQDTLRRTMEAIVEFQKNFFLTGDESALRPMILKNVSQRAGYDVSTISRVSNSKYVQTNFGIYPLKFFFSDYLQTDSGEEITTREVKKILKEYIDSEDKRKPLTDEELTVLMKEKGFPIARRTVAKYREQLEISVARLRKEI